MEINDTNKLFGLMGMLKGGDASAEIAEDFANILNGAVLDLSGSDSSKFLPSSANKRVDTIVAKKEEKPEVNHKPKKDRSAKDAPVKKSREVVSEEKPGKVAQDVADNVIEKDAVGVDEPMEGGDEKEVDTSELSIVMVYAEHNINGEKVIEFLHPETGERTLMNAVEFVEKLASGELPPLDKESALLLGNELSKGVAVEESSPLHDLDLSADGLFEVAGMDIVKDKEFLSLVDVDTELSPEHAVSNKTEVVLGNEEKKLDVIVTSKEEKNSPASNKDLLSQDAKNLVDEISSVELDSEVAINSPIDSTPLSEAASGVVVEEAEVAEIQFNAEDAKNIINSSVSTASAVSNKENVADINKASDLYKGMSKDIVEQVKVNITKSAVKGVDKIDIQLKPAGFGNVEVKLSIAKDGKLQAQIFSSNLETMEVLQKDALSLEKALNDAGFDTKDGGLSFSLRDEQEAKQENSLRSFIGKALDEDVLVTDTAQDVSWDGKSSLNIRV